MNARDNTPLRGQITAHLAAEDEATARDIAALSHARRGGRVEVGAFVPVGEAVPGAEWRRS